MFYAVSSSVFPDIFEAILIQTFFIITPANDISQILFSSIHWFFQGKLARRGESPISGMPEIMNPQILNFCLPARSEKVRPEVINMRLGILNTLKVELFFHRAREAAPKRQWRRMKK